MVFELTGDVQQFAKVAARVIGLEFLGAEDLEADETDPNPVLYLMVPDARALRELLSLWRRFLAGDQFPGAAQWRYLFGQLRDVRPWGPADRVTEEDLRILADEHAGADGLVRLEVELVYRRDAEAVERDAREVVRAANGQVLARSRIDGAAYHALLVKVPEAELTRIRARAGEGLVGADSIQHIRPQSLVQVSEFETQATAVPDAPPAPNGAPIAAILDAVPVAGHPRLAGRLVVDDPFNLEPLAVGSRQHGTAMASAVVHGDLHDAPLPALARRVAFVNVMYAPGGAERERFPDRLPADIIEQSVLRLVSGAAPVAPETVVVNVSLGDPNKPFAGRMSGWARVLDYLAHQHGLLFVVSAGNHLGDLTDNAISSRAFEALNAADKARSALRSSAAALGARRLLSPAESINALSVGAHSADNAVMGALPAGTFDVWADTGMCTVSSALGPGQGGAIKPDVIAAGGRHPVRVHASGLGHLLRPIKSPGTFAGILVAAPTTPADVNPDRTSRTVGTSVAAALLTGIAARAHEALESAYADFAQIPRRERALLLKALVVHSAKWTNARDLIVSVLGGGHHSRQRDNVRRYIGYGAIEPFRTLECAEDRATLWAVGRLSPEQGHTFSIPWPASMSARAEPHSLAATLAWFAPPKFSALAYRGVRLRLLEPHDLATAGVRAASAQPDQNQARRGTVIHRRWDGDRAAAIAANGVFQIAVQREPDEFDEPVSYAVAFTLEMPGVQEVYVQVRDRVVIQPAVPVAP